jgi:hypothetical protein
MLCATMPCEFTPAVTMLPPTSCVTLTVPPGPAIGALEPNVMFATLEAGPEPLSIVTRPPPPPTLCASTPKESAPWVAMLPPRFDTATVPPAPFTLLEKGPPVSVAALPTRISTPLSAALDDTAAMPPPPPTLCARIPGANHPCVAMRPMLLATLTVPPATWARPNPLLLFDG